MSWFRPLPWTARDYWALDLETSGLDPKSAEVLSVGMVPIRRGAIRWGERWSHLVRPAPGYEAATEAVVVHEILPDELGEAPLFPELVPQVAERLDGAVLLVHWGRLDVPLLRRGFRDAGLPWPRPKVVDTVDLLHRLDRRRRLLEPEPRPTPTQLAAARQTLGLPRHQEHSALYDALATAELFLALRARLHLQRLRQLI